MKVRYYWILLGAALILVAAGLAIRFVFLIDRSSQEKTTSTPADEVPITLQTCGSSAGSISEELVPDRNPTGSESLLSEIPHGETVPKEAWSQRAGFSTSSPAEVEYWAGMLGSGWYLDWGVRDAPNIAGLEHWQMVRVHEDCITPSEEKIRTVAMNYPGQVWVIGNEPDVIWQDNVSPAKYAAAYHELYRLIKSSDPTALVAVGGVAQATPLRLEYLDTVLETYKNLFHEALPADWWTVHGYVLREEKGSWGVEIPPGSEAIVGELREVSDHGRLDLFEEQLISFRKWMEKRGYQDTPLALTEFGILMPKSYGFPDDLIASYLEQTFTWLFETRVESTGYPADDYRLVQRWAWFSLSSANYSSANLGDLPSGRLTIVGERFRNMVYQEGP